MSNDQTTCKEHDCEEFHEAVEDYLDKLHDVFKSASSLVAVHAKSLREKRGISEESDSIAASLSGAHEGFDFAYRTLREILDGVKPLIRSH